MKNASHIYLGKVSDEAAFSRFMEHNESDSYDEPQSEFYKSQDVIACDMDFVELGRRNGEKTLKQFFKPYSYSKFWSAEVCRIAKDKGLEDANVLLLIDEPEIDEPKSVRQKGFELLYLGKFEYPID